MINGVPDGDWSYANDTGRLVQKKHYDKGQLSSSEVVSPTDTSRNRLKPGEVESSFPGGLSGWRKYLLKKITFPDRALKLGIRGEVGVQFVVNTQGEVESAALYRSVEYSLDVLALSIISGSPEWSPAYQEGHTVKSYKKEPLVFNVQSQ